MTALGGPYREHPIVLLRNFFLAFQLTAAVGVVGHFDLGPFPYEALCALMILLTAVSVVIIWYLRTLEIGEQGVVLRYRFLIRKFSTLAYVRVATVHHDRGLFDRLCGTSSVKLNLNSAVRAVPAEVSFTFGQARAAEVQALVYQHSFRGTADKEPEEHQPLVCFRAGQVLAHAILGQPTVQLLIMLALVGLTVAAAALDLYYLRALSALTLIAFCVLVTYMVVPVLYKFSQFYRFRLWRDGEAICIEHGLVIRHRTEFAVPKISAVHMRQPWLARLVHRSYLEAEVVGLRLYGREFSPTLCLLQKNPQTDALLHRLLPEFRQDIPEIQKGKAAEHAMLLKTGLVDLFIFAVASWLYLDLIPRVGIQTNGQLTTALVRLTPLIVAAVLGIYLFRRAYRRYFFQNIGLGENMLVMRNGVTDRDWVEVPYDRIARVDINGDFIALAFGVCRIYVYILGNSGPKRVVSGYFPRPLLQQIPDLVKARINDGRYDIRENMV